MFQHHIAKSGTNVKIKCLLYSHPFMPYVKIIVYLVIKAYLRKNKQEIFYNFVGAIDRPIWGDELSDEDD